MADAASSAYKAIAAQLAEWDDPIPAEDISFIEASSTKEDAFAEDAADDTNGGTMSSSALVPSLQQKSSTNGNGSNSLSTKLVVVSKRRTGRSETKTHSFRINEAYHDALALYLEKHRNATKRLLVLEQQVLNGDITDQSREEDSQIPTAEIKVDLPLEFMKALASICSTESSQEEWNTWSLLYKLLQKNGVQALIYNPPATMNSILWQDSDDFVDVNLYPAQMVQKALTIDPSSSKLSPSFQDTLRVLQRRVTIVQWIEACIARQSQVLIPPRKKNVAMSCKPKSRPTEYLHLDTPFYDEIFAEESELLKVVVTLLQCGDIDGAKQCCRDAGQSWRAATLLGGQYYGLAAAAGEEETSMTVIGNPNRMQWKKQCQLIGQSLFQKYRNEGTSSTTSHGVSYVVYEAALYAILSRDVPRALQNPVLQSWNARLWISFSALVECTLDQLLEYHTTAQSAIGVKFPFSSSNTWPHQHQEYVDITTTMDEGEIIYALSSTAKQEQESNNPYKMLISSAIMGKEAIYNYLMQYVYPSCQQLSHNTLRFATHFMLMLRFSFSEELPELPYNDEMMFVLKTYIKSLLESPKNLPLLALYTSLLSPADTLVNTYVSCCLLDSVNNSNDDDYNEIATTRQMMLDLARKHFADGLDLVILRRVVKSILDEPDNENEYVVVTATPLDSTEVSFTCSNLRKLQAIQWLCFYPEHRLDGIVFANALLRRLLLQVSAGEDVSSLIKDTDKLVVCKCFIGGFFPPDSRAVAEEYVKSFNSTAEGNEYSSPTSDFICSAVVAEHSALIAFLEAHQAYEEWCSVITSCELNQPPLWSSLLPLANSGWNAAEKEIASQQEYRSYRNKMATLARTVFHTTETIRKKLLHVLKFPGGWLDYQVCGVSNVMQDNIPEEWALERRETEMFSLQEFCIFRSLIMLHTVLDGTASWVDRFSAVIDVAQERDLFHSFVDFLSTEYWYRKCMELSTLVLDRDLQKHIPREQLKVFLKLMAESAVNLVRCTATSTSTGNIALFR